MKPHGKVGTQNDVIVRLEGQTWILCTVNGKSPPTSSDPDPLLVDS